MKAVILAGGFGLRFLEETKFIPKPMVKIGNKPILWHLIKYFYYYNIKDVIILGGYKYGIIKNYFKENKISNIKITVVNTGLKTMTGGRIKKIEKLIDCEDFIMTYGDGLSDININKLIKFHKNSKKIVTVSAVRPPARWGSLETKGPVVIAFSEKSQIKEGWINGGFFVLKKDIFKYIKNSEKTIFEKDVVPILVKKKNVNAYLHNGFWQCMDNLRDKNLLNSFWKNKPRWKVW
jgi:glucose-1-phosphate cytidylyltransferase